MKSANVCASARKIKNEMTLCKIGCDNVERVKKNLVENNKEIRRSM